MKIIVIQGPAASGKTRNADRFAAHYGISNVIDFDDHGTMTGRYLERILTDSVIILTQHSREAVLTCLGRSGRRFPSSAIKFVPIEKALRMVGR